MSLRHATFCVIMNITFAFKRTRTFGFYMNTNLSNQSNFFGLNLSRKKLQLLVVKTNTRFVVDPLTNGK